MSRMFLVRDYHDERRQRERAFAFRLVGLVAVVVVVLSVGPIADSLSPIYRVIGATIGLN